MNDGLPSISRAFPRALPRTPPRWLLRVALVVGAWIALGFIVGGPILVTDSALANSLLQAIALPLVAGAGLWWAITTRAPRLLRLVVGVPLIPIAPVTIVPLLFLATCGPFENARYGEGADHLRVQSLPLAGGGEAVVYRDGTGGATVRFSMRVRQERALPCGLRLSRSLYSRYGASSAELSVDADGQLVIRPDDGPAVRRTLRPWVVF